MITVLFLKRCMKSLPPYSDVTANSVMSEHMGHLPKGHTLRDDYKTDLPMSLCASVSGLALNIPRQFSWLAQLRRWAIKINLHLFQRLQVKNNDLKFNR